MLVSSEVPPDKPLKDTILQSNFLNLKVGVVWLETQPLQFD